MTDHRAEALRIARAGYLDDGHASITHAILDLADAIRENSTHPRCLAISRTSDRQCIHGRDHTSSHELKTGYRW